MKAFTKLGLFIIMILLISFIITCAIGLPVLAAGAGSGTGGNIILGILTAILNSAITQGLIITALVALLAWLFTKEAWMKNVCDIAIVAYEYAENQGMLQGLKGYQKFDPFMNRFISAYQEKFGTVPPPEAKGLAVKAMETKVQAAHAGN